LIGIEPILLAERDFQSEAFVIEILSSLLRSLLEQARLPDLSPKFKKFVATQIIDLIRGRRWISSPAHGS
jgi:hypothetical protein